MSELTTFLLAQIAADEAVARAGISSQSDPENGWGYGGYGSPNALTPHVGVIHERVQAEHIIRWHPARVLAECAAKRRIVELHASDSIGSRMQWCKTCADWENNDYDGPPRTDWPCPTLRALASVYAGQDGWREEWS